MLNGQPYQKAVFRLDNLSNKLTPPKNVKSFESSAKEERNVQNVIIKDERINNYRIIQSFLHVKSSWVCRTIPYWSNSE